MLKFTIQPIFHPVPFEYTGTVFEPPPTTVEPKVVVVESDTKVLVPAFDVDAAGSVATV
jgi:hypothetical protein